MGANLRIYFESWLCISLDETTTRADIELLWKIFAKDGQATPSFDAFESGVEPLIPPALRRASAFLTHPVFNTHHSETAMLRYIRQLSDKDLALDRSMIPLGSCTMKLNATSEMIPITWPEFADIHPFCPADQRQGYAELDEQLRAWLCAATGYAGISLQPNAGSQGEYAGLLAIQAWHASRGESHRTICLIPSSAHGTNPASAQMAGLQVVVTKCDENGNVDIADLRARSIAGGSVREQSVVGQAMTAALGKLFAVAEAYPELKADANFRDLQDKLAGVEDEIQLSRRYYNGAVRNLNTMIQSFPSNFVAGFFKFTTAEFFEIGDAAAREVPKVDFKK